MTGVSLIPLRCGKTLMSLGCFMQALTFLQQLSSSGHAGGGCITTLFLSFSLSSYSASLLCTILRAKHTMFLRASFVACFYHMRYFFSLNYKFLNETGMSCFEFVSETLFLGRVFFH